MGDCHRPVNSLEEALSIAWKQPFIKSGIIWKVLKSKVSFWMLFILSLWILLYICPLRDWSFFHYWTSATMRGWIPSSFYSYIINITVRYALTGTCAALLGPVLSCIERCLITAYICICIVILQISHSHIFVKCLITRTQNTDYISLPNQLQDRVDSALGLEDQYEDILRSLLVLLPL